MDSFDRASELTRGLVTLSFEEDDEIFDRDETFDREDSIVRRELFRIVRNEPEDVVAHMLRIFALAIRDVYDDQREFQQYMLEMALRTSYDDDEEADGSE